MAENALIGKTETKQVWAIDHGQGEVTYFHDNEDEFSDYDALFECREQASSGGGQVVELTIESRITKVTVHPEDLPEEDDE